MAVEVIAEGTMVAEATVEGAKVAEVTVEAVREAGAMVVSRKAVTRLLSTVKNPRAET